MCGGRLEVVKDYHGLLENMAWGRVVCFSTTRGILCSFRRSHGCVELRDHYEPAVEGKDRGTAKGARRPKCSRCGLGWERRWTTGMASGGDEKAQTWERHWQRPPAARTGHSNGGDYCTNPKVWQNPIFCVGCFEFYLCKILLHSARYLEESGSRIRESVIRLTVSQPVSQPVSQ